jgi:hypothetical protein
MGLVQDGPQVLTLPIAYHRHVLLSEKLAGLRLAVAQAVRTVRVIHPHISRRANSVHCPFAAGRTAYTGRVNVCTFQPPTGS